MIHLILHIICNWWRKVRKIRIFANQNAYYTGNSYEDPKNSGFSPKLYRLSIFHAEYTKNLGHLMRFFRKIRKFTKLSVQLISSLTFLIENSKKSEFSAKWVQTFKY